MLRTLMIKVPRYTSYIVSYLPDEIKICGSALSPLKSQKALCTLPTAGRDGGPTSFDTSVISHFLHLQFWQVALCPVKAPGTGM